MSTNSAHISCPALEIVDSGSGKGGYIAIDTGSNHDDDEDNDEESNVKYAKLSTANDHITQSIIAQAIPVYTSSNHDGSFKARNGDEGMLSNIFKGPMKNPDTHNTQSLLSSSQEEPTPQSIRTDAMVNNANILMKSLNSIERAHDNVMKTMIAIKELEILQYEQQSGIIININDKSATKDRDNVITDLGGTSGLNCPPPPPPVPAEVVELSTDLNPFDKKGEETAVPDLVQDTEAKLVTLRLELQTQRNFLAKLLKRAGSKNHDHLLLGSTPIPQDPLSSSHSIMIDDDLMNTKPQDQGGLRHLFSDLNNEEVEKLIVNHLKEKEQHNEDESVSKNFNDQKNQSDEYLFGLLSNSINLNATAVLTGKKNENSLSTTTTMSTENIALERYSHSIPNLEGIMSQDDSNNDATTKVNISSILQQNRMKKATEKQAQVDSYKNNGDKNYIKDVNQHHESKRSNNPGNQGKVPASGSTREQMYGGGDQPAAQFNFTNNTIPPGCRIIGPARFERQHDNSTVLVLETGSCIELRTVHGIDYFNKFLCIFDVQLPSSSHSIGLISDTLPHLPPPPSGSRLQGFNAVVASDGSIDTTQRLDNLRIDNQKVKVPIKSWSELILSYCFNARSTNNSHGNNYNNSFLGRHDHNSSSSQPKRVGLDSSIFRVIVDGQVGQTMVKKVKRGDKRGNGNQAQLQQMYQQQQFYQQDVQQCYGNDDDDDDDHWNDYDYDDYLHNDNGWNAGEDVTKVELSQQTDSGSDSTDCDDNHSNDRKHQNKKKKENKKSRHEEYSEDIIKSKSSKPNNNNNNPSLFGSGDDKNANGDSEQENEFYCQYSDMTDDERTQSDDSDHDNFIDPGKPLFGLVRNPKKTLLKQYPRRKIYLFGSSKSALMNRGEIKIRSFRFIYDDYDQYQTIFHQQNDPNPSTNNNSNIWTKIESYRTFQIAQSLSLSKFFHHPPPAWDYPPISFIASPTPSFDSTSYSRYLLWTALLALTAVNQSAVFPNLLSLADTISIPQLRLIIQHHGVDLNNVDTFLLQKSSKQSSNLPTKDNIEGKSSSSTALILSSYQLPQSKSSTPSTSLPSTPKLIQNELLTAINTAHRNLNNQFCHDALMKVAKMFIGLMKFERNSNGDFVNHVVESINSLSVGETTFIPMTFNAVAPYNIPEKVDYDPLLSKKQNYPAHPLYNTKLSKQQRVLAKQQMMYREQEAQRQGLPKPKRINHHQTFKQHSRAQKSQICNMFIAIELTSPTMTSVTIINTHENFAQYHGISTASLASNQLESTTSSPSMGATLMYKPFVTVYDVPLSHVSNADHWFAFSQNRQNVNPTAFYYKAIASLINQSWDTALYNAQQREVDYGLLQLDMAKRMSNLASSPQSNNPMDILAITTAHLDSNPIPPHLEDMFRSPLDHHYVNMYADLHYYPLTTNNSHLAKILSEYVLRKAGVQRPKALLLSTQYQLLEMYFNDLYVLDHIDLCDKNRIQDSIRYIADNTSRCIDETQQQSHKQLDFLRSLVDNSHFNELYTVLDAALHVIEADNDGGYINNDSLCTDTPLDNLNQDHNSMIIDPTLPDFTPQQLLLMNRGLGKLKYELESHQLTEYYNNTQPVLDLEDNGLSKQCQYSLFPHAEAFVIKQLDYHFERQDEIDLVPFDTLDLPTQIKSFPDLLYTLRKVRDICTYLRVKRNEVKNSNLLARSYLSYIFTHLVPIPLSPFSPTRRAVLRKMQNAQRVDKLSAKNNAYMGDKESNADSTDDDDDDYGDDADPYNSVSRRTITPNDVAMNNNNIDLILTAEEQEAMDNFYYDQITYAQSSQIIQLLSQISKILIILSQTEPLLSAGTEAPSDLVQGMTNQLFKVSAKKNIKTPATAVGGNQKQPNGLGVSSLCLQDPNINFSMPNLESQVIIGALYTIMDFIIHKIPCDQRNLMIETINHGALGLSMGDFIPATNNLLFKQPELALVRARVIEYFDLSTPQYTGGTFIPFKNGDYTLGDAIYKLYKTLRVLTGSLTDAINSGREAINDQHIIGFDNDPIHFRWPELGHILYTTTIYRFMMFPTSTVYSTDAVSVPTWDNVHYKNDLTISTRNPNSHLSLSIGSRMYSTPDKGVKPYYQPSPINPHVIINDFLYQLHYKKNPNVEYKPLEIQNEDDILHIPTLPSFSSTLSQQDSEQLLSYLTVPYLRIPLITSFFAQSDRTHALRDPTLRLILESCLFEQGTIVPFHDPTINQIIQVPAPDKSFIGTRFGMLFNELVHHPKLLINNLIRIFNNTFELDIGLTSTNIFIILFMMRILSQVQSYVIWLLELNRPAFIHLISDEGDNDIVTMKGRWFNNSSHPSGNNKNSIVDQKQMKKQKQQQLNLTQISTLHTTINQRPGPFPIQPQLYPLQSLPALQLSQEQYYELKSAAKQLNHLMSKTALDKLYSWSGQLFIELHLKLEQRECEYHKSKRHILAIKNHHNDPNNDFTPIISPFIKPPIPSNGDGSVLGFGNNSSFDGAVGNSDLMRGRRVQPFGQGPNTGFSAHPSMLGDIQPPVYPLRAHATKRRTVLPPPNASYASSYTFEDARFRIVNENQRKRAKIPTLDWTDKSNTKAVQTTPSSINSLVFGDQGKQSFGNTTIPDDNTFQFGSNEGIDFTNRLALSCSINSHIILIARNLEIDADMACNIISAMSYLGSHHNFSTRGIIKNEHIFEIFQRSRRHLVQLIDSLRQQALISFMEKVVKVTTCLSPINVPFLLLYIHQQITTIPPRTNNWAPSLDDLPKDHVIYPVIESIVNADKLAQYAFSLAGKHNDNQDGVPSEDEPLDPKIISPGSKTVREYSLLPGTRGRYVGAASLLTISGDDYPSYFHSTPYDLYNLEMIESEINCQTWNITIRNSQMQVINPTITSHPLYTTLFGSAQLHGALIQSDSKRQLWRVIGTGYTLDHRVTNLDQDQNPAQSKIKFIGHRKYHLSTISPDEVWVIPMIENLFQRCQGLLQPQTSLVLPDESHHPDCKIITAQIIYQGQPIHELRFYRNLMIYEMYCYVRFKDQYYPVQNWSSNTLLSYQHTDSCAPLLQHPLLRYAQSSKIEFTAVQHDSHLLTITRDTSEMQNLSGTIETLIPNQLLGAVIPSVLLHSYLFWQDTNGDLRGYPLDKTQLVNHEFNGRKMIQNYKEFVIFAKLLTVDHLDLTQSSGTTFHITKVPLKEMKRRLEERVMKAMYQNEHDEVQKQKKIFSSSTKSSKKPQKKMEQPVIPPPHATSQIGFSFGVSKAPQPHAPKQEDVRDEIIAIDISAITQSTPYHDPLFTNVRKEFDFAVGSKVALMKHLNDENTIISAELQDNFHLPELPHQRADVNSKRIGKNIKKVNHSAVDEHGLVPNDFDENNIVCHDNTPSTPLKVFELVNVLHAPLHSASLQLTHLLNRISSAGLYMVWVPFGYDQHHSISSNDHHRSNDDHQPLIELNGANLIPHLATFNSSLDYAEWINGYHDISSDSDNDSDDKILQRKKKRGNSSHVKLAPEMASPLSPHDDIVAMDGGDGIGLDSDIYQLRHKITSKLLPYTIELPHLALSFHTQFTNNNSLRLYSIDHNHLFVSNFTSTEINKMITNGMSNSLLLQTENDELSLLVPTYSPIPDPNPYSTNNTNYIRQSTIDTKTPTILYPIHPSHTFIHWPSLTASLYALVMKFLHRDFDGVVKLQDSISSDIPFTSTQNAIFNTLTTICSRYSSHPDAIAAMLHVSITTQHATKSQPWGVSQLLSYYSGYGYNSLAKTSLQLPPHCELDLLKQLFTDEMISLVQAGIGSSTLHSYNSTVATYNRLSYLSAFLYQLPSFKTLRPHHKIHMESMYTVTMPSTEHFIKWWIDMTKSLRLYDWTLFQKLTATSSTNKAAGNNTTKKKDPSQPKPHSKKPIDTLNQDLDSQLEVKESKADEINKVKDPTEVAFAKMVSKLEPDLLLPFILDNDKGDVNRGRFRNLGRAKKVVKKKPAMKPVRGESDDENVNSLNVLFGDGITKKNYGLKDDQILEDDGREATIYPLGYHFKSSRKLLGYSDKVKRSVNNNFSVDDPQSTLFSEELDLIIPQSLLWNLPAKSQYHIRHDDLISTVTNPDNLTQMSHAMQSSLFSSTLQQRFLNYNTQQLPQFAFAYSLLTQSNHYVPPNDPRRSKKAISQRKTRKLSSHPAGSLYLQQAIREIHQRKNPFIFLLRLLEAKPELASLFPDLYCLHAEFGHYLSKSSEQLESERELEQEQKKATKSVAHSFGSRHGDSNGRILNFGSALMAAGRIIIRLYAIDPELVRIPQGENWGTKRIEQSAINIPLNWSQRIQSNQQQTPLPVSSSTISSNTINNDYVPIGDRGMIQPQCTDTDCNFRLSFDYSLLLQNSQQQDTKPQLDNPQASKPHEIDMKNDIEPLLPLINHIITLQNLENRKFPRTGDDDLGESIPSHQRNPLQTQPLSTLDINSYIAMVTRQDKSLPPISDELPFDLTGHDSTKGVMAEKMLERLNQDVKLFSQNSNSSKDSLFSLISSHTQVQTIVSNPLGIEMSNVIEKLKKLSSVLIDLRGLDLQAIGVGKKLVILLANNIGLPLMYRDLLVYDQSYPIDDGLFGLNGLPDDGFNRTIRLLDDNNKKNLDIYNLDLTARLNFLLSRFGGRETPITLEYIIGAFISSRGVYDLLKLNPFIPHRYANIIFFLCERILLQTNRITQINRTIGEISELLTVLYKHRSSNQLQVEVKNKDSNNNKNNIINFNPTSLLSQPSHSSSIDNTSTTSNKILCTGILQRSAAVIAQLENRRHYYQQVNLEKIIEIKNDLIQSDSQSQKASTLPSTSSPQPKPFSSNCYSLIVVENLARRLERTIIDHDIVNLIKSDKVADAVQLHREGQMSHTSKKLSKDSQVKDHDIEKGKGFAPKGITKKRKSEGEKTLFDRFAEQKEQRHFARLNRYNQVVADNITQSNNPQNSSRKLVELYFKVIETANQDDEKATPSAQKPNGWKILSSLPLQHKLSLLSNSKQESIDSKTAHPLKAVCPLRQRAQFVYNTAVVQQQKQQSSLSSLTTQKSQPPSTSPLTPASLWNTVHSTPQYQPKLLSDALQGRYGVSRYSRSGLSLELINSLEQLMISTSSTTPTPVIFSYDPRYLVFEFTWSLLLRKTQVEMVDDISTRLKNGESLVKGMIMGAGKSVVVAPLVSLMLSTSIENDDEDYLKRIPNHHQSTQSPTSSSKQQGKDDEEEYELGQTKLVLSVVPPALLEFSRSIMRSSFSSVIFKRIVTFQFDRATEPTIEMLQSLHRAARDRAIVIATPTSLKAVLLKMLEVQYAISNPTVSNTNTKSESHLNILTHIIKLFRRSSCIFDESDTVFHVLKSELNFPFGEKEELDFSPLRWTFSNHMLSSLSYYIDKIPPHHYVNSKRAIGILNQLLERFETGFEQKALQTTPHLVLLNENYYFNVLQPVMIDWAILFLDSQHIAIPHEITRGFFSYSTLQLSLEEQPQQPQQQQYFGFKSTIPLSTPLPPPSLVTKTINAQSPHHIKLLVLARDWLQSYLPHVMQKICRVHYGTLSMLDLELALQNDPYTPESRQYLAVPFVGINSPSPTSEYSHPDIVLALTSLSYQHSGLRYMDFIRVLDHLRINMDKEHGIHAKRPSMIKYVEWVESAGGSILGSEPKSIEQNPLLSMILDPADIIRSEGDNNDLDNNNTSAIEIMPLRLLKPTNYQEMDRLYNLWKAHPPVIEFYLSELIFPTLMRHQHQKISASGVDLGSDLLFARRCGFSGTPSDLLPLDLGHCHYELGSDGKIITTLTSPSTVKTTTMGNDWDVKSILDFIATSRDENQQLKYHVFIDTASLITGMSNYQVAEYLLNNGLGPFIDGIVFLDEGDRKMVLVKATNTVVPLEQSGIPPQRRFAFYDQVHSTGIDITHRSHANALVSLGKDMTFRDYAQGCYRMRGLETHGQTLEILIVPEIQFLINRVLSSVESPSNNSLLRPLEKLEREIGNDENNSIMNKDELEEKKRLTRIAAFLLVNQMNSERVQFCQLSIQNSSNIWKKAAFGPLLSGSCGYFTTKRFTPTIDDQREEQQNKMKLVTQSLERQRYIESNILHTDQLVNHHPSYRHYRVSKLAQKIKYYDLRLRKLQKIDLNEKRRVDEYYFFDNLTSLYEQRLVESSPGSLKSNQRDHKPHSYGILKSLFIEHYQEQDDKFTPTSLHVITNNNYSKTSSSLQKPKQTPQRDQEYESLMTVFWEKLDLDIKSTVPKFISFYQGVSDRIKQHQHLLNTPQQKELCDKILKDLSTSALDEESIELNTEMVQILEDEREQEQEKDEERTLEIEKAIETQHNRRHETPIPWPIDLLSQDIDTKQLQFYHGDKFGVVYSSPLQTINDDEKQGELFEDEPLSSLDQRLTIQYPKQFYLSNNYYNPLESGPVRRLKNVTMYLDLIPQLSQVSPWANNGSNNSTRTLTDHDFTRFGQFSHQFDIIIKSTLLIGLCESKSNEGEQNVTKSMLEEKYQSLQHFLATPWDEIEMTLDNVHDFITLLTMRSSTLVNSSSSSNQLKNTLPGNNNIILNDLPFDHKNNHTIDVSDYSIQSKSATDMTLAIDHLMTLFMPAFTTSPHKTIPAPKFAQILCSGLLYPGEAQRYTVAISLDEAETLRRVVHTRAEASLQAKLYHNLKVNMIKDRYRHRPKKSAQLLALIPSLQIDEMIIKGQGTSFALRCLPFNGQSFATTAGHTQPGYTQYNSMLNLLKFVNNDMHFNDQDLHSLVNQLDGNFIKPIFDTINSPTLTALDSSHEQHHTHSQAINPSHNLTRYYTSLLAARRRFQTRWVDTPIKTVLSTPSRFDLMKNVVLGKIFASLLRSLDSQPYDFFDWVDIDGDTNISPEEFYSSLRQVIKIIWDRFINKKQSREQDSTHAIVNVNDLQNMDNVFEKLVTHHDIIQLFFSILSISTVISNITTNETSVSDAKDTVNSKDDNHKTKDVVQRHEAFDFTQQSFALNFKDFSKVLKIDGDNANETSISPLTADTSQFQSQGSPGAISTDRETHTILLTKQTPPGLGRDEFHKILQSINCNDSFKGTYKTIQHFDRLKKENKKRQQKEKQDLQTQQDEKQKKKEVNPEDKQHLTPSSSSSNNSELGETSTTTTTPQSPLNLGDNQFKRETFAATTLAALERLDKVMKNLPPSQPQTTTSTIPKEPTKDSKDVTTSIISCETQTGFKEEVDEAYKLALKHFENGLLGAETKSTKLPPSVEEHAPVPKKVLGAGASLTAPQSITTTPAQPRTTFGFGAKPTQSMFGLPTLSPPHQLPPNSPPVGFGNATNPGVFGAPTTIKPQMVPIKPQQEGESDSSE